MINIDTGSCKSKAKKQKATLNAWWTINVGGSWLHHL